MIDLRSSCVSQQVFLLRISDAMLRFQAEMEPGTPFKPRMANDLAVALGTDGG